jgi:hypothetical protein
MNTQVESNPEPNHEEIDSETPLDVHQDSFRKVYLGQASDPIYPPCSCQGGVDEDELTRAALEDPDAVHQRPPHVQPGLWHLIFLAALAVFALGFIFVWRR